MLHNPVAMSRPLDIFVSVCEASADVHAASLVRAAAVHLPSARFHGLTGPRLRTLGVDTVYDFAQHAAMLGGVIGLIGTALHAMRLIEASWRQRRPDVVVLLDSPELHLRIAHCAHQSGLPVLYYIAPQTWASRAGRNRQIACDIDALACILPFEQNYFQTHGVPRAKFVGHPLFETLARQLPDSHRVAALRRTGRPLIALLPGSRRHVIDATLPLQLQTLADMQRHGLHPHVSISAVDEARVPQIRAWLHRFRRPAEVIVADNASLLTAADLVLVASGTATLEVAYYRKPMIVMYDAGTIMGGGYRWLGRWVVKTPHLSLVNILAGKRVVPEFMPTVPDPALVARVAADLLRNDVWRRLMQTQLDEIVRPLEASEASAGVCRIIAKLANVDTSLE